MRGPYFAASIIILSFVLGVGAYHEGEDGSAALRGGVSNAVQGLYSRHTASCVLTDSASEARRANIHVGFGVSREMIHKQVWARSVLCLRPGVCFTP